MEQVGVNCLQMSQLEGIYETDIEGGAERNSAA
jgi:hypothetical protein